MGGGGSGSGGSAVRTGAAPASCTCHEWMHCSMPAPLPARMQWAVPATGRPRELCARGGQAGGACSCRHSSAAATAHQHSVSSLQPTQRASHFRRLLSARPPTGPAPRRSNHAQGPAGEVWAAGRHDGRACLVQGRGRLGCSVIQAAAQPAVVGPPLATSRPPLVPLTTRRRTASSPWPCAGAACCPASVHSR